MEKQRICYNCFKPISSDGACPHCGYSDESMEGKYPLALPEGTILDGRYIVGRVLGQGGFGATYVAQEYSTKKLIAIKEYLPVEMATRDSKYDLTIFGGQHRDNFAYGKECFLNEAKTLAKVKGDPNVVEVFSFFEEHNTAYFTMEYVEGRSLQQVVKESGGRISTREANRILVPVMRAIGRIHKKGIIHRDIAPDNIMINADGTGKLIDFGAARYSIGEKSCSLDVLLKHGFAPKEQYTKRGRQGPYTDVYAMAATYYYAITGRVPQEAIDRMELDQLVRPSALGADIDQKSELALLKAMAIQAADRYQNMEAFIEELVPEQPTVTTTKSLLVRAKECLKEGDWERAALFFSVLSEEEPKNAEAWLGKALAENKLSSKADLAKMRELDRNENFQKALTFAAPELRQELEGYLPKEPEQTTPESLLRRAKEYLKEGNWEKATLYFNVLLGEEPENAEAWLGKVLAENKLSSKADLTGLKKLDKNESFKKALAFAMPELKQELEGYLPPEKPKLSERMKAWFIKAKKKLIIALSSIAALIAVILICTQLAEGSKTWEYDQATRTLTISGSMDKFAEIDQSKLPWALYKDEISVVSIGDGVKTVCDGVFKGYPSLSKVNIRNGVESIGAVSFSNCKKLKSVSLSNSVLTIGTDAFSGCDKLEEVTMSNAIQTISSKAFYGCPESMQLYYDGTDDQWMKASIAAGNDNLVAAYYTMLASRPELVLAEQAISIEATDKKYNYISTEANLLPGQIYTLLIDEIEVNEGSTNKTTCMLWDFGAETQVYKETVFIESTDNGYSIVFYTPEKLAKETKLLLYSGPSGATNNIGITYKGVRLYRGLYTARLGLSTTDSEASTVPLKQYKKLNITGSGSYNSEELLTKVEAGRLYTVCAERVTVNSGDPLGIEVLLYDAANDINYRVNTLAVKGQKENYRCVVQLPSNVDGEVSLLLFGGQAGATNGMDISFENLRVYSGVYLD